jgi:hypothetical protein
MSILELLVTSLCVGSNINTDACYQAWNKIKESNLDVRSSDEYLYKKQKRLSQGYIDPIPDEVKYPASAAAIIHKRRLKFGLIKPVYLDVQFDVEKKYMLGAKWSFP